MSATDRPSAEPVAVPEGAFEWHRVLGVDELPEGRVTTVSVGRRTLAVTHAAGAFGVMSNRCPHQGGPLGEGSIEKGWLRCPWHGYDYSPCNGQPPEGFDDAPEAYASEVRDDGVYVALPAEVAPGRTVSDVMVETMVNWGVDSVFGMVGHSNLGFADAMHRAEQRGDLRYFGIRHEGAASFAATAYGKLTGRLAACFGIAGPGSTNLLTGLYDAKVDRAPVLALSGQVPSKTKGRGAFQDMDLANAFKDVARFGEVVLASADHAELMTLACKTAIVDKDVAHLIFPDEVQVEPSNQQASGPDGRTGPREISPPPEVVAEAVERIRRSERPVIVVGQGARADIDGVVALAELIGAPVITTFKAKGAISDHHPLGCGVLGRSGTPVASWLMNESDLVVAFGASFSNHTGIAPYKPIIQIDHDPMAIGRHHPVDLGLQGAVATTARLLAAGLGGERECVDQRAVIADRWRIWREEKASRRTDDHGRGMNAASVFAELSDQTPDDAVICVDVGNNTYSFGRYFEVAGQDVLMSGYLGSIGFALPAAMGAWAAVGDTRKVVSVSGDGGFGQYAMELTTAVKYGMGITHVLLNNHELGKISKEQRAGEFDVWATSLHNPDFAAFAQLCGAYGVRVTERDQLHDAIASALAHDGPSLVEIVTDPLLM
ncbi:thiamine pyrophosphate-dependent enzyme [Nocardioides donggukensis]|uniref:Rieske 2Fe-2S domain-containing protein n=1 Tax=Nocardioides donggukensis TaxID=2774019 RepID=A0A927K5E2_9ACTN|nr:thiamine pyrophosphate-binding protein [Nocardioides donggukensis]MBD8869318.1 Rieske 2Fe-2S domain-containing protein [Nocardioides donggukensis]